MNIKPETITIHPVHRHAFSISEHPEGQLRHLGDALGSDCIIERFVGGWMRRYKNDGINNEDWYGWGTDVLAPFDGIVESVHSNPTVNTPGAIAETRASSIVFVNCDGIRVLIAHVANIRVGDGDAVKAGDVVAQVGNNGYSRHPHIHIGAWKGQTPLQIKFDLREMGKQFKELGDERYYR